MNYDNINNGDPVEAFDFFLGTPNKQYSFVYPNDELSSPSKAFDFIERMLKKKYLIVIETLTGYGTDECGLPSSHSFTVIDTLTLKGKNKKTYNVLKLLNPWKIDPLYKC